MTGAIVGALVVSFVSLHYQLFQGFRAVATVNTPFAMTLVFIDMVVSVNRGS